MTETAGMGEKLNDYDWTRKASDIYPWDEWLNGDSWRLEQGRDFTDVMKCIGAARQAARRRNGRVRTSWDRSAGWIVLRFEQSD